MSEKRRESCGSHPSNRKQPVISNGKSSNWSFVSAGVLQGSVLGVIFFLVYINDVVENASSDAKLAADDTSLFTVVYDEGTAADQLIRDLKVISDWTYQFKMQFNPNKNKQAIQVIFFLRKEQSLFIHLYFVMNLRLKSKMNKKTQV